MKKTKNGEWVENEARRIYHEYKHEQRYIRWEKEAETVELSLLEYKQKLEEIESTCKYVPSIEIRDGKTIAISRTLRSRYTENTYDEYVSIWHRKVEYRIYANINGEYFIFKTKRNGKEFNHFDALKEVGGQFKERTGKSLLEAFGATPYETRTLIPQPIYFCNNLYKSLNKNNIFKVNVSSVDGCSQYPTAACDKLPTTEGMKVVNKYTTPTEEYPFAFYPNSGHVAVYNEFDTHEWINSPYVDCIFPKPNKYSNTNYYEKAITNDNETWLMKASEFTFKPEMEYWFNIKETYPKGSEERNNAKIVMNSFIGKLHYTRPSFYLNAPFAHLAAVIIARANDRLINKINQINFKDMVHICVDGFVYKGNYNMGVKERKLGNFELEYENCTGVFKACNYYMIKDSNNNLVKLAHSGVNLCPDGSEIDSHDNFEFEDMYDFQKIEIKDKYADISDYMKGGI